MGEFMYIPDAQPFWFLVSEVATRLLRNENSKVNGLLRQYPHIRSIFDAPNPTELERNLCFKLLAHTKVLEIVYELFLGRWEPTPELGEGEATALGSTSVLVSDDAPNWALEMNRVVGKFPHHLFNALPDALLVGGFSSGDQAKIAATQSAANAFGTIENLEALIERVIDQQFERLAGRWSALTGDTAAEQTAPAAKKPKHWLKGTHGLTRKADLSQYIQGLTEKQQLAASLKWEYGLGLVEIASRMGINRKTAFEHIDAARRKMDEAHSNEKHKADRAKRTLDF